MRSGLHRLSSSLAKNTAFTKELCTIHVPDPILVFHDVRLGCGHILRLFQRDEAPGHPHLGPPHIPGCQSPHCRRIFGMSHARESKTYLSLPRLGGAMSYGWGNGGMAFYLSFPIRLLSVSVSLSSSSPSAYSTRNGIVQRG